MESFESKPMDIKSQTSNRRSCECLSPYARGWRGAKFLLAEMVKRDFKARYNRSMLGMCWCLLQPTLTMALLYYVFSVFFRSSVPNFPLYLISGIVIYQFFTESTSSAMLAIRANSGLVTKINIPMWIYPATRAVSALVNFGFSLAPLFAVMIMTKTPVRFPAIFLPYGIAMLLFFSLGVGMMLSALVVFFHDIEFLWGFGCLVLMYATPVFYPDTLLSPSHQFMLYFNPLYHFIHFTRTILIHGAVPPIREFLACGLFAVLSMGGGISFFLKLKRHFIHHL